MCIRRRYKLRRGRGGSTKTVETVRCKAHHRQGYAVMMIEGYFPAIAVEQVIKDYILGVDL